MSRREAAEPAYVYPFREDSAMLLPWARLRSGLLLEVMCGEGRAALEAARAGARVVAADLNPHALRQLARRAGAEGLGVNVVRTDLFRGLTRFDRILANPPYVPTPSGEGDPNEWADLALNGGPDGGGPTRRILRDAPRHLRPGGCLYLLRSTTLLPGVWDLLLQEWLERGGSADRVDARPLEGEELQVWALAGPGQPPRPT